MAFHSRSSQRRLAWSAPVLTIAAVTAATVLPGSASASDHPRLPARTAAQLLASLQTSDVTALSGTIVETARLGLPSLPGAGDSASLSAQTLISGTHTARVWLDGADRQRLALLGQLSESDVVHDGRDLWTYASGSGQVGHTLLPAERHAKPAGPDRSDLRTYTPQGAADQALRAIDPSTAVRVDPTARVAGRPAYTLVLTPRDSRSTVREVRIALDAARSVPLRVQVFGAAAKPAFETAFTNISYATPAASVFRFVAPRGSVVTHDLFPSVGPRLHRAPGSPPSPRSLGSTEPKVLGKGWTSVLETPAGQGGLSALTDSGNASLVNKLMTTLPNGDRLLSTALVNVLVTKDGRLLVGAVSPAVLQQAAAGTLG